MRPQNLIASVAASVIGSVIWWLASPGSGEASSGTDLTLLRTPVHVTLRDGRTVSGELQGADSLCADWTTALQASPDTRVRLPGGVSVRGGDVTAVVVDRSALSGLKAMGNVSACPDPLTVHPPGETPAVTTGLQDGSSSLIDMRRALDDLTGP